MIASGIILIMCIGILGYRDIYSNNAQRTIIIVCLLVILFLILSLIYGCLNIRNFNELRDMIPNDNILARKINIVVVIIGYILLAFNIFIIPYISCLSDKFEQCCYNICNKNRQRISNTANNSTTIPNNNNSDILKNINPQKDSVQNVNNK